MLRAVRCKVGIALKLAGCALIHGWGRHRWTGPVFEWRDVRSTSCQSCGKYRDPDVPEDVGAALRAWRRISASWGAVTEPLVVWAGRLGCRVLDRHHYLACRGRRDHLVSDRRGYPAPVRRR